ncbi:Glyoxylase, beta-lactamase superfamily II [Modestobacter sp. DSM 44400]|uniref:N-acyl homoserine lactonase family protein n=1 Tax=Modestobacter sp. DSM 44400 TaxID=1550230 RepID=UPI00089D27A6|nr:N-acyl homoserine lactonase family protein [Modestobacter sp. DSM 44400]SDY61370.1 Glyoxylase, beta-lactamase superfamily II [Modestobacter sp. DSM 44400]
MDVPRGTGTAGDDVYEVIVVRHGTRSTSRSDVFLNYGQYGEPDAAFTVDYYLWILRNSRTTVLIDTGFARGPAEARGRTVLVEPAEAYRRLGVDTTAPHPIVVTHAHYDHIGNVGLFPRSPVVISGAEMDFWTSPMATRTLIAHFAESDEVAELVGVEAEGRLRRFSGSVEVAPGVVVTEVGGHTPGQCMVTVPTTAGVVLLTSDAVHFTEELERDMPFISVTDLPAMYRGLQSVRDLLAAGAVDHILTGHDAGVLDRLEPYSPELAGVAGIIGRLDP